MKKVLPLVLFVLLAFAGCQRGPATFEFSKNPRQFSINAEKFVNQVEKKSKHYSAEDWEVAVKQFVDMSKDFVRNRPSLTLEDQMRFDNARLKFMGAIDKNGNEEIAKQVKELYSQVME